MTILSKMSKSLLFVHIPKTGGTAVESCLQASGARIGFLSANLAATRSAHRLPCSPQHFHAELIRHLFTEDMFALKLSVVRHPVDRMLSEYGMQMLARLVAGQPCLSFKDWLVSSFRDHAADPYHADNHFRPQAEFIDDTTEVFYYEDGLRPVVDRIAAVLELDEVAPLAHVNVGPKLEGGIDEGCVAAIRERYAVDFRRFGYGDWKGIGSGEGRRYATLRATGARSRPGAIFAEGSAVPSFDHIGAAE
jgi:hypothetical protein